jgi:hypothetical protein
VNKPSIDAPAAKHLDESANQLDEAPAGGLEMPADRRLNRRGHGLRVGRGV